MSIRIVHVVDSLGKGGLENGLVNVISHLDPNRFEHVVVTMRSLGPNADLVAKDRVRVLCLARAAAGSDRRRALVRTLRQLRPDVVHSRNWGTIEAVLAARRIGCPAVHSEHGLQADSSAKEPLRRRLFRRLAYELAARILAVSHELRDYHSRQTGFPASRISVIHNGVDADRFSPLPAVRAAIRRELGILPEEFCIGTVGNLFPVKDQFTLLRALDNCNFHREWRLLVIGDGPERQRLEEFTRGSRACTGRVMFLGSSNRVAQLLNAMDVYILPSVNEGISNSLLEAMATAIPPIATAVGGTTEVIQDGESGLLFGARDAAQLAQSLAAVCNQEELRIRLAESARRRVCSEFSLAAMIRGYEDLYQSIDPREVPRRRTAVACE